MLVKWQRTRKWFSFTLYHGRHCSFFVHAQSLTASECRQLLGTTESESNFTKLICWPVVFKRYVSIVCTKLQLELKLIWSLSVRGNVWIWAQMIPSTATGCQRCPKSYGTYPWQTSPSQVGYEDEFRRVQNHPTYLQLLTRYTNFFFNRQSWYHELLSWHQFTVGSVGVGHFQGSGRPLLLLHATCHLQMGHDTGKIARAFLMLLFIKLWLQTLVFNAKLTTVLV